jgi:hypothetical protein
MQPYFSKSEGDDGKPIAIINGGAQHGKIIYLHTDDKPNSSSKGPFTPEEVGLLKSVIDNICRRNSNGYRDRVAKSAQLKRAIIANIEPKDPDMRELFKEIKITFKKERTGCIQLSPDERFDYIPSLDSREVVYVAGPSGSGKSYWTKSYAQQYNRIFKKNPVILFSKVDGDESLEGIKNLKRIPLNDEFLAGEYEADDFEDCLVIFDDTDTVRNLDVLKEIEKLKEDILETGRHANVYCCITSHLISDYRKTRTVLNECHRLVIYPASGGAQQIRYVLQKYFGYDKDVTNELLKTQSRWVMCSKNFPQFYMGSHYLRLIQ